MKGIEMSTYTVRYICAKCHTLEVITMHINDCLAADDVLAELGWWESKDGWLCPTCSNESE